MRKVGLIFAFVLVIFSLAFSQNEIILPKTTVKNVVRYNPYGTIIWNTIPIYYERKINPIVTVSVAAGYMIPRDINISKLSFESSTIDGLFSNGKLKGHYITPEFRFYFGKKAPNGFYFGRYFKYRKVGIELDAFFSSKEVATTVDLNANIYLKEYGTGRQFGYQWIIADRWSIDWFFAGYGYSTYKLGIAAEADIDSKEWEDFANELNERYGNFVSSIGLKFLSDRLPFDPFNPKVNYAYPFTFFNFRHGISVGFSF